MNILIMSIIIINILIMNITIINIVRQIFFRDETSDKPKENRVVKFHDEAPERGRPAKKSMKVMITMFMMMMMIC